MAEQFTEIVDLFDIDGVVQSPWTRGPQDDNKLLMTKFVDGRVQIYGAAYLDSTLAGAPIAPGQLLFDLRKVLPEATPGTFLEGLINMWLPVADAGVEMQLNTALYRAPLMPEIVYRTSVLKATVTPEDVDWHFSGWLLPQLPTDTSSLLWGK